MRPYWESSVAQKRADTIDALTGSILGLLSHRLDAATSRIHHDGDIFSIVLIDLQPGIERRPFCSRRRKIEQSVPSGEPSWHPSTARGQNL